MTFRHFSQAAENNAPYILEVLRPHLEAGELLEIGSGTGQHAAFLASHFPAVAWQPSERDVLLADLTLNLAEEGSPNILEPIPLDVNDYAWTTQVDFVYTTNTLHIMSEAEVELTFRGVAGILKPGGKFFVYGPFNYDGKFSSQSNQKFDGWLKARDPASGIRDIGWLKSIEPELELIADIPMPANNQLLVFSR